MARQLYPTNAGLPFRGRGTSLATLSFVLFVGAASAQPSCSPSPPGYQACWQRCLAQLKILIHSCAWTPRGCGAEAATTNACGHKCSNQFPIHCDPSHVQSTKSRQANSEPDAAKKSQHKSAIEAPARAPNSAKTTASNTGCQAISEANPDPSCFGPRGTKGASQPTTQRRSDPTSQVCGATVARWIKVAILLAIHAVF